MPTRKVQKILDTAVDEKPPETSTIKEARKASALSEEAARIAAWADQVLAAAEELGIKNDAVAHFSLSSAQRQVLLLLPGVSKSLKCKLARQRAPFTVMEIAGMTLALAEDLPHGDAWKQVAVLLVVRHLMDQLQAVFGPLEIEEHAGGPPKPSPGVATIYQLKITLKGIEPPIWRRIQIEDCSLDQLHAHIQAAMGWTNSHLHQFEIGGVRYGDP